MIVPEGIEGDYIETKNNSLIFDVKGLLHPNDRRICYVRFVPDLKGKRVRKGINYRKIYDLEDRFRYLEKYYPKYIFYSDVLDLRVQGVKIGDIKSIYNPRTYFSELKEKKVPSKSELISKELCKLFIQKGKLPEDSIGVSGSQMVGLSEEDSDIDVIIYGTQASIEFQEQLKEILNTSYNCRKYNLEEFKEHYTWRVGGSGINFNDFLRSETRKLHQGKYKNIDFFIRYIKSPEDWQGSYNDYRYKNYGRVALKAEIIDSKDSIFTPCSYKIHPIKIVDLNSKEQDISIDKMTEISSFRGRFCEHAKEGEIVHVEGKLEKIMFSKTEYFRIILQDQIRDKMILLK